MIQIIDKQDCVGCNACTQICPKKCISMSEDHEGFIYPKIDLAQCIDCGRCNSVCPVINQNEARLPSAVYAVKNIDESIRKESSSGGVFTLLAEQVILKGGVVFGVRFDAHWEVVHSYCETIEELKKFRGSKYVQSVVGDSFRHVSQFLKSGRQVLFTGTPCQVAGLNKYLNKSYPNLLTVDFVCHGVPSPKVFNLYLNEIVNKRSTAIKQMHLSSHVNNLKINDIQFRSKELGWKKFSFNLSLTYNEGIESKSDSFSQHLKKNIFMKGFLSDLYLRPSCSACPSKSFKSGSDITIGDFWGIENFYPDFDDDRGCSLVLINSDLGLKYYTAVMGSCKSIPVEYKIALKGNSAIEHSVEHHPKRTSFFEDYTNGNIIELIYKTTKPRLMRRILSVLFSIIKRMRSCFK